MNGIRRGRRHGGWIEERDGVWYACFRHKGRRYRESARSSRVTDAQRVLDRMRREILAGTYVRPSRRSEQIATVGDLARRWLETHVATARREKDQRQAATRVDKYLIPFMGSKRIAEVQSEDLQRYRLALEAHKSEGGRKLSVQTVRHLLSDARAMWYWAEDKKHVARSPFPRKLLPRAPETEPRALSPDEAASVAVIEEPYGLACRIMLGVGVRWGELVRLESACVLRDGTLSVYAPKTGKLRHVPIPPALLRELRGHVGKLVPFEDRDVTGFDRAVRRRSGVESFGAHRCRHTFAFRWLAAGGNLGALQVALGHSTITMTMRYAKPTEELLRRESERLYGAGADA